MAVTGTLTVQATLLRTDRWVDVTVHQEPDPHEQDALAFAARRASNPARAARLQAMRERLGTALQQQNGAAEAGLAGLRLKAGLSQQQVAQRMDTQQPSVARWERDPASMRVATMQRLAQVLGVDLAAMAQAISAQLQAKELQHA